MPEPSPGQPSSRPCRIRVTAEIVVQLASEAALLRAAAERVDGAANARAVALLADPAAAADGTPGVQVVHAVCGAEGPGSHG